MRKYNLLFPAFILLLASLLPSLSQKLASSEKSSPVIDLPPMVYPIRIGLATRSNSSWLYAWEPAAVCIDKKPIFVLAPRHVYMLINGCLLDKENGKSFKLPYHQRTYIIPSRPFYRICTNNHWYRGCLELVCFGNRITVINILDMEDYLRGVVPAEMPATWHIEALKAQAVAARSYAYAHSGQNSKWFKSEGYDVVPDTRDQMYKGLAAETKATDAAIGLTLGTVLADSGRVKPGFYRAWVGDNFENLNMRRSTVSETVLEKITSIPNIIGVVVKQWDENSNARSIEVIGAKKSREVYGVALAKMLHFSTAGILDVRQEGSNWLFTYRGPGNGSRGLSQHGANMLAKNGWNFIQILQQYYEDPDGHLKFARLPGYPYGNYMHRPRMQMAKTNKKDNVDDQSKTDESQPEESTTEKTQSADEKDKPKADKSKGDQSSDSKTEKSDDQ